MELFSQHLVREFSTENIDFYNAVKAFKEMHGGGAAADAKAVVIDEDEEGDDTNNNNAAAGATSSRSSYFDDLKLDADEIIRTYIKPGSVSEVNIPHTMSKKLIASVQEAVDHVHDEEAMRVGGYSHDMFNEAQDEIYKLMARDSFSRY